MPTDDAPTLDTLLRHQSLVRAIARDLLVDPDAADDVVQQTWLAALRHAASGAAVGRSLLARIATNLAFNRRREARRRAAREQRAAIAEPLPSVAEIVEREDERRRVVDAVLALNEPLRTTVLRRYLDDRSEADVAAVLGIPIGTVRMRLHRARELLRERLGEHGDAPRSARALAALAGMSSEETIAAIIGKGVVLMGVKAWLGVAAGVVLVAAMSRSFVGGASPSSAEASSPVASLAESHSAPVEQPAPERSLAPTAVEARQHYFGQIVDLETKEAVPGAVITFEKPRVDRNAKAKGDVVTSATSDTDGRFSIDVATAEMADDAIRMRVSAPGFMDNRISVPRPDREARITMKPACALAGRVLDKATGAPIAGARVSGFGSISEATDGDGRYSLAKIPRNVETEVFATCEGYADASVRLTLRERGINACDLQLDRGVSIEGIVVDRDSLAPIAGVEVDKGSGFGPFATTDASGRFVVRLAPAQPAWLTLRTPSYCELRWSWDAVELLDEPRLRFPLVAPAAVEVDVHDDQGGCVAGAVAYLSSKTIGHRVDAAVLKKFDLPGHASEETKAADSRCNALGRVTLTVVPSPAPYTLTVNHADFVAESVGPIDLATPGITRNASVVLHRGGSITGTVLRNGEAWSPEVSWKDAREERDWKLGSIVRAAASGRYELKNVRAGEVTVQVHGERRFPPLAHATLTVVAGQTVVQDFTLHETIAPITGRVTLSSGVSAFPATVYADATSPHGASSISVETDERGEYSLATRPDVTYRVSAAVGSMRKDREDVRGGSAQIDFVIPACGRLRLRLVDHATKAAIQVTSIASRMDTIGWKTGDANAFRFGGDSSVDAAGGLELEAPVGLVDVSINFCKEGYRRRVVTGLEVTDHSHPDPVTIELERGSNVTVRTADGGPSAAFRDHVCFLIAAEQADAIRGPFAEEGGPSNIRVDGVNVWMADYGLLHQQLLLQDQGVVVLHGVAPGTYSFRVLPDDVAIEPASVEVTAGADAEVSVRARAK